MMNLMLPSQKLDLMYSNQTLVFMLTSKMPVDMVSDKYRYSWSQNRC